MIDIHCHILPGVDDGAADMYDVLEMATMAYSSGVKAIIATPHCNIPGQHSNYYGKRFREVLQNTRKALADERIPLKLMAGMEVFATFDLPDLIADGKILTLNHSDYLLIEFDFNEDPEFAEAVVERLIDIKIRPVIAHPERYEFIKYDSEIARRLVDKGCVLQANKGSFLGKYGSRTKQTAFELVEKNLLSIVASDAHSPVMRTPYMLEAYREVDKVTNARLLFEENPQKICLNQPI